MIRGSGTRTCGIRGLGPVTDADFRALDTKPAHRGLGLGAMLPRHMEARGCLTMRSYGRSDVGRRRATNQDAFLCDDELGLWAVADGMGGPAAGEVASHESSDTIGGTVKRGKQALDLTGAPPGQAARAASRPVDTAEQPAT